MSGTRASPVYGTHEQALSEGSRRLRVEVVSTSKPVPGPQRHTYLCDADLRISEGEQVKLCKARLTVHHPRGWLGVAAGFEYDVDAAEYPTFEERAEFVHRQVLEEFPSDEIISVFLLGTGESCFPGEP